MSLRDFKNQQLLGKGSYGAVYRAERKSDGFECVLLRSRWRCVLLS